MSGSTKVALAGIWVALLVIAACVQANAVGPDPTPVTQSAQVSCVTDAAGWCTVSHGLGAVPATGLVSPVLGATTKPWFGGVGSFTVNTFRVRAMYSSTNPVNQLSVTFNYVVFGSTVTPPTSTTTVPPTTTTAPPSTAPTTTVAPPPPAPAGFPTPATTGVPNGEVLTVHNGNFVASQPGQVVDKLHITGSLLIEANGVIVKRTQVDDSVVNDTSGSIKSFMISDSTIGPAVCGTAVGYPNAVGFANYTAERLEIRGHEDGFRASGPGITIKDSYVKICAPSPEAHADGVQDYPSAQNLVIDHNTVDMRGAGGYTAPLFIHSTTTDTATITNNLVAGGVFSVYLQPTLGHWIVTGNRVVAGTWDYGAYEAEGRCTPPGGMVWSDNDVVTIDSNYQVTGTTQNNVPC